jgi:signal transduction histidine kinase
VRHARARTIEVGLAIVDEHVELRVDDDGIGFSTAGDAVRRRGLGILSLEERAKLLGGSFDLDTTPGKGTRICIRIPLQSRRSR